MVLSGVVVLFYMFIINDIHFKDSEIQAREILEYLLSKESWAFSLGAANLKRMSEGDKVVVYLAGKGKRYFAADFTLKKPVEPVENRPSNYEPYWMDLFPVRVQITNIEQWEKPVYIKNILNELNFITDKKNYGLFLRFAPKALSEKDFNLVLGAKNANNETG